MRAPTIQRRNCLFIFLAFFFASAKEKQTRRRFAKMASDTLFFVPNDFSLFNSFCPVLIGCMQRVLGKISKCFYKFIDIPGCVLTSAQRYFVIVSSEQLNLTIVEKNSIFIVWCLLFVMLSKLFLVKKLQQFRLKIPSPVQSNVSTTSIYNIWKFTIGN